MIIFKPFLGLANRIRSINSAVALSKHLKTDIQIVWVKDFKLNSYFSDLFKIPIETNIHLYEPRFSMYNLPFTIRFNAYMNFIKKIFQYKFRECYILNSLNGIAPEIKFESPAERIFISSFYEFYPSKFNKELFRPNETISEKIEKIIKTFDSSTFGVHLRRTDNPISIKMSPTELFVNEIDIVIKKNPAARFYLATDSTIEKKYFIHRYGDRIITSFFQTSRNSREGMENAVVDMFVLSKTKMIFGSYFSSFSDISAVLGGIPIKIIRK